MKSIFDDWWYPCSDCQSNEKCYLGCQRWREWFETVWREACEPFREIRKARDERIAKNENY